MLTIQEREGVNWAADYLRANLTDEEPARFEHRLALLDDDFNEITFGTPDCVCGPDLFDLKWAEDDYEAQLYCYAAMRMCETGRESINCHILFALQKWAQKFTVTREEAIRRVFKIIEAVKDSGKQPTPCDACGWCANAPTCPALAKGVESVVAGREDWTLETYHASQILDPAQMAKALFIADRMKDWIDGVRYHANQMVLVKKQEIPGHKVQERKGDRFFSDINLAHRQLGIPTEKFLACLSATFSKLVEAYAAEHQVSLKAAEKEILAKCGDNVQRAKGTSFVTKIRVKKGK